MGFGARAIAIVEIARNEASGSSESRLGPARAVMRGLSNRAQTDAQRIVFPEGEDLSIVKAARILADDGVAQPILLGDVDVIRRQADDAHLIPRRTHRARCGLNSRGSRPSFSCSSTARSSSRRALAAS